MKGLFEEQQSPDNSNYASTSGESKDDQEMGTNSMSKSVGGLKTSSFSFLSKEMDANFARAVRRLIKAFLATLTKLMSVFKGVAETISST